MSTKPRYFHEPDGTPFSINVSGVRKILFLVVIGLASASITGSVLKTGYGVDNRLINVFIRFFNLALENNVPTLISFLLLIVASGVSAMTWWISKKRGVSKVLIGSWLLLSGIFFFLSFDEALQIHESLNYYSDSAVKVSRAFYYSWTIPYGILTLSAAAFFIKFLRLLPSKIASLFICSGILYAGGAILFEFLEGYYVQLYGVGSMIDVVLYTIEETCELSGISLYIYAVLLYLSKIKLVVNVV